MKTLLSRYSDRIDINARDERDNTVLHNACEAGHLNIVQSLLNTNKRSLLVNLENADGNFPATLAALGGHALVVKRLIQTKRPKVNNEHVAHAVMKAVEKEDFEMAKLINDEYRQREGRDLDPTLAAYLKRYLDCLKTKDEASEVCKIGIKNCFKAKEPPKERKDRTKEDILRDIQEYYLECNICNEEFADGELYSCENDHWLCRNCKSSLRAPTCPTCRCNFGEGGPARRLVVEKLLAEVSQLRNILSQQGRDSQEIKTS